MLTDLTPWLRILLAAAAAFLVSYLLTPPVRRFAVSIGAIDMPNERRVNKEPIPRGGGIAVFVGFTAAMLLFTELTKPVAGILLGSFIIALVGFIDDVCDLNPWLKLLGQVLAAAVAIYFGVTLNAITSLALSPSAASFINVNGWVASAITLFWIVGCTNAVNLIDGLDGLASGISAISALTMLVVSLMVSDLNVTVILGCILGACAGFLPYNINPAKIFLGDVGSQFLGFVLATASTLGLFKMHAAITFLVPLLALAVPLADTVFAIVRRISKGQSPFKADKGHFHHRLLRMGLNQKQVVSILWGITAIMGLVSILMTGSNPAIKIICTVLVFLITFGVWVFIIQRPSSEVHKYSESEPDVKIYNKGDKS